jgi:hypothetical protein
LDTESEADIKDISGSTDNLDMDILDNSSVSMQNVLGTLTSIEVVWEMSSFFKDIC